MSLTLEAPVLDPLDAAFSERPHDEVRVCLVVPQSGALGLMGPSALNAALLATHEVNAGPLLGDAQLSLVLVDGGQSPAVVAASVRGLCQSGAVDVVAGFHTSDVHRAVEAAVAGWRPYLFTPPHEGGPRRQGVVCTGADPAHQMSGAIAWLTQRHGVRRWALVGNDYIWPRSVHQAARPVVTASGAGVVLDAYVPLGRVGDEVDRLLEALNSSRADAILLSLVGRDLVEFNGALRHAGLDRRLLRLCGALEENSLLALEGDDSGTLFGSMPSFASMRDDRRVSLDERYVQAFGDEAPVLDTYAEGVYDGIHLVAALASSGSLDPDQVLAAARRLRQPHHRAAAHLARAEGLGFQLLTN